jgi:hypothetical protein
MRPPDLAHALQPVENGDHCPRRNGQRSATDGYFAEATGQLGGCLLIEARDLNEAIQVAARIPPAPRGRIEGRPIRELRP